METSNRRNIPESFFTAVRAVFPKSTPTVLALQLWTLCGGKSFIKLNAAAQYFNWTDWESMKSESQLSDEDAPNMTKFFTEVLEKYKDPNFLPYLK